MNLPFCERRGGDERRAFSAQQPLEVLGERVPLETICTARASHLGRSEPPQKKVERRRRGFVFFLLKTRWRGGSGGVPRVASADVPRDRKAWRLSVRVGCFARLCLYGASVREAKKCAAASGMVECAEEEVEEEETVFGVFFPPEWAFFVIPIRVLYPSYCTCTNYS